MKRILTLITVALLTPLAMFIVLMAAAVPCARAADGIPQNVEELWADFPAFDKATPLDTEILRTWEEDGVVMNIVRFNVGKFDGQMLKVAGYYAFPKGGTNLPTLVQCNGGGQKAIASGPLKWARDGYACFLILRLIFALNRFRPIQPERASVRFFAVRTGR